MTGADRLDGENDDALDDDANALRRLTSLTPWPAFTGLSLPPMHDSQSGSTSMKIELCPSR